MRYAMKPHFARLLLLPLLLATAACAYDPPKEQIAVQNVAIKPDGSRVAVLVKFEGISFPIGLAAFPDGGAPKATDQRADIYVVSLPGRKLLSKHALNASCLLDTSRCV